MFAALITLVAALPLAVLGAPSGRPVLNLNLAAVRPLTNLVACPLTNAAVSLPGNQTTLSIPAGQTAVNVALGVGTQNYTCTAAGTYTSAGAVAKLFDISCMVNTPGFAKVQDDFSALPKFIQDGIVKVAAKTPLLLAEHYFISNSAGGISPKFAQVVNGGNPFVTVAKAGGIKSPVSTANIDWLQLNRVDGDWSNTVFRVDTKLGQPPATCTPGPNTPVLTVPYVAKYWFYK